MTIELEKGRGFTGMLLCKPNDLFRKTLKKSANAATCTQYSKLSRKKMTLQQFKWKRLILILLTYIVISVLLVPFIGKDLPYSKFYQSTAQRDTQRNLEDNSARLQNAQKFLATYKPPKMSGTAHILPEFCFVVITVSRPAEMGFLTQVVAGLLAQLTDANAVYAIYNAEGWTHSEAVQLSYSIPVITNPKPSGTRDKLNKEKEDLVYALQWCFKKKPRYTIIIEDDALPVSDFMTRLMFILKQHVLRMNRDWAFLKLFYPPKWQGWSNETVGELLLTSVLVSFLLTTAIYSVVCLSKRPNIPTKSELILVVMLSFSLVLYTLWTLGRPHWLVLLGKLSIHFNFIVPAPGCCTPAVLYPQEHLTSLIKYLNSIKCSFSFPIDTALDKFADMQDLKRLLVVPDLFKHIGFVSSLGKGWKNPQEFRF